MALRYQIQDVPGKGQGLVAQQDIRTGTRILSEAPLLTTEGILSASQTEGSIAKKMRRLSKAQQPEFLSLPQQRPWKVIWVLTTSWLAQAMHLRTVASGYRLPSIFVPEIFEFIDSVMCGLRTNHRWPT